MVRSLADRFWPKVEILGPDECWLWLRSCDGSGYGQISVRDQSVRYKRRNLRANRVVWELTYGPIPAGLFVCHKCDNPKCCNPRHLWLGTNSDNMIDCKQKGRVYISAGELSGTAKLTTEAAEEILTSDEKVKDLARKFGVSLTAVYDIRLGRTWRCLRVAA